MAKFTGSTIGNLLNSGAGMDCFGNNLYQKFCPVFHVHP